MFKRLVDIKFVIIGEIYKIFNCIYWDAIYESGKCNRFGI